MRIRASLVMAKVSLTLPALLLSACFLPASRVHAQAPPSTSQPAVKSDAVAPRVTVDLLAEIKKGGGLRVGITEIVPWAMHDKDGNLVGLSVDVARKLARDMDVEVEFHPV